MYDKSTRILYVLEQLIQRNEVKKDEIQEKFRKVHKLKSNERKSEIQTRKRRP